MEAKTQSHDQQSSIASKLRQAKLDPRSARVEDQVNPQYKSINDHDVPDGFLPYNPNGDSSDSQDGRKQRKEQAQRRIGAIKTAEPIPEELFEEDIFDFLGFLDKLWIKLSEIVESISQEFETWNKWFKKKEKKAPPEPDKSQVFYVREEFNTKRSPHMWKSNPDKQWVLTFGNNKINNMVSSILYKYQNETISKDA